MNKTIILFVSLLLSFSVLSEDIAGFEIGGKIKDEYQLKKIESSGVYGNVYSSKNVPFFDGVEIETDKENIIRAISFIKTYNFTVHELEARRTQILDDYTSMLSSLESKYGSFDNSKAKNITGYKGKTNSFYMGEFLEKSKNESIESKSLGGIYMVLNSPYNEGFMTGDKKTATFILAYLDKSALEKMKNERKNKFNEF